MTFSQCGIILMICSYLSSFIYTVGLLPRLLLFTMVTSEEGIFESIVIKAGLLLLLVENRLLSLPILFFNNVDKPGLVLAVVVAVVVVVTVAVSIIFVCYFC
jgi:hypothetical protein